MELDAADAAEVPFALVAVTVNVYAVFGLRPPTVMGLDPVPVNPPGDDVAVYVDTAKSPFAPAV